MLSAYFDESGTHRSSKVCVVAGLVASPKRWQKVASAWQKTLDLFQLPDFHMNDCAHRTGHFRGWETEKRDLLLRRLVSLVKTVSYRVWAAVLMDDYRARFAGDKDQKGPYRFAAIGCASQLAVIARRMAGPARIPCVFEAGGKGSARAFMMFRELMRAGRSDYYRMGGLTVAPRTEMLPLQAADLHAYEVHKYLSDQLKGWDRVRGSFRELLSITEVRGHVLNGDDLEILIQNLWNEERDEDKPLPIRDFPLNQRERVRLIPPPPLGLNW